ncbi:Protein of uncharacterised function (DUF3800) [Streptococcus uberis]|nr:Protein of uncharacterised function (DUF3800) [Streptococcus uberis]
MCIGGVSCPNYAVKKVSKEIRDIKEKYGFAKNSEMKWRKISNTNVDFYKEIVNYFFNNEFLAFRVVILPDKNKLRHDEFEQSHDDFYYKLYYFLIRKFVERDDLKVFIDIKDTKSIGKVRQLKTILGHYSHSYNHNIKQIQQIRSHESEILQISDLIIGACSYKNRGLNSSNARIEICNLIQEKSGHNLTTSTSPAEQKFNIFKIRLRE